MRPVLFTPLSTTLTSQRVLILQSFEKEIQARDSQEIGVHTAACNDRSCATQAKLLSEVPSDPTGLVPFIQVFLYMQIVSKNKHLFSKAVIHERGDLPLIVVL
jgi:hypothetical protein